MTRPTTTSEHRRYPRIARALKIRVNADQQQLATKTINVSCGGTLCWVDRAVPPMTKVAIDLALPQRLVHCAGVVVRCQPAPAGASGDRWRHQLAVFFTEVRRDDHRAIAEFVLDAMFTRANGRRRP
ncbi:MAG: PilZ domain-containing protein [Candidatus Omnitrophica bacterium]|nr:PilZ domain-containing protein [Candidatus Omnitrophota bacterium]